MHAPRIPQNATLFQNIASHLPQGIALRSFKLHFDLFSGIAVGGCFVAQDFNS